MTSADSFGFGKRKLLIFIVAYQAETTIRDVVSRIPLSIRDNFDSDVLIIDDSSSDRTFEHSYELSQHPSLPFRLHVLFNPVNQGYGGNQKLGYRFAIENGYDLVALVHGDGQYAPESLPSLLEPLTKGADAVFGSRMMVKGAARKGGMPLYKFIGNIILTRLQNWILRANLSEFHSGYRLYSVEALKSIPFEHNSNGFDFDTEIIIQLLLAKLRIVELPIPTFYGNEICRVDGIRYGLAILKTSLQARMQQLSLFYDRKYDCGQPPLSQYVPKLGYQSTHSMVLDSVSATSRVLDLGCGSGYMGVVLKREKGCVVTGVDAFPTAAAVLDDFCLRDLNDGLENLPFEDVDVVLLLDVIEHLAKPEKFLDELRERLSLNPNARLIISTGNVAFFITRLMLIFGQFNYGKRGILDLTHTRLFTFKSLQRALNQSGFIIETIEAVPAPFPLALGTNGLSRTLLTINSFLNRISRSAFAYQMIMRAKPLPTVEALLRSAHQGSLARIKSLRASA